ncbi:uncharacterized protein LOC9655656 isoform X1 [Selaginella moellendorffii]|uniref:uncharacterized protein LOC9655656 isoform X1 n=1 Tax=Selaginella moellendorffii TaxID=88036 RepID=UPI000D1C7471|nr:uncharacterized protein LOC9655656 isoform X1 [Selaginella moellendorffii]|eukprot:XP_024524491.1 uncharacterized protein LOC9655656 isoform X1 [Selaginella moellendorffii]
MVCFCSCRPGMHVPERTIPMSSSKSQRREGNFPAVGATGPVKVGIVEHLFFLVQAVPDKASCSNRERSSKRACLPREVSAVMAWKSEESKEKDDHRLCEDCPSAATSPSAMLTCVVPCHNHLGETTTKKKRRGAWKSKWLACFCFCFSAKYLQRISLTGRTSIDRLEECSVGSVRAART